MNNAAEKNVAITLQPKTTAIAQHEYTYTPEQIELMKRTVSTTPLTDDEFKLFIYVAKAKNLDPLQRQVHAVKRSSWDSTTKSYVERMTIQTGIDGYRAIANRTGLYMPSEKEAVIEGSGTADLRVTFYVKKWSDLDKQFHEYSATAYYREFVQTYKKKDGTKESIVPNSMWEKMPINQLTKCAEALALRKGWPEELASIRTDEEMQQADSQTTGTVLPPEAEKPASQERKAKAAGTLKQSAEQNRGHGNEGSQRATVVDEKPKQEAKTDMVGDSKTKATSCGIILVKDVEYKTKKSAKKDVEPTPYAVIGAVAHDAEQNATEFDVFIWHKTLINNARLLVEKSCQVELAATTNAKGTTFYSLEQVFAVEGMPWSDNQPMPVDGISDADIAAPAQGLPLEFNS